MTSFPRALSRQSEHHRRVKGSLVAVYCYFITILFLLSMRMQKVHAYAFSGSGSIATAPILGNWFFAYSAARPDVTLSYNGLAGPANAMNFMISRTSATDFIIYNTSVPDSFSARTIPPNDMFQFPAVSAPYVMAYNLPYGSMMDPADSSAENRLVLDTNVTAAIFAFAVTNWRDPQILSLQTPTVAALLPNATIKLIVRQYGTDNIVFCNAVKRFNPSLWRWNISDSGWDAAFRNKVIQEVPGAFSAIMNTPNSLAYTNYPTIAGQDSFKFAAMVNLAGELMYTPDLGPAIDATPFDPATLKFSTSITSVSNRNISGAWPMGNIFFAVIRKLNTTRQLSCDATRNLMQFWRWVFVTPSCSQRAKDSGYTPIPTATVDTILAAMDSQLTCYETGQTLLEFVANPQHTGEAYPAVLAITVLCAIATTALFVIYVVRDYKQLSVSALSYYVVLFVGSVFNYAAFGLFWMVPSSNSVCLGRLWLGCLGFSMMLGAIFCRAYQVWAIRNLALSKSLSRGVRHCLIQAVGTGSVVAAQALLLAVWTGVDPFSAINVDVSDTDLTFNWICSSRHPKIWWSLEVVFVIGLLSFGLYVVYQTWDLKHMVKESKWISASIYNCVVALMLVGVLLSLTSPSDDGVFWTAGGSTLFLTFTIMLGMFLPRVLDIKSMTDNSGSEQSQLDATRAPDSSGEKSPRTNPTQSQKSPSLGAPRLTSKFGPSSASRMVSHHSSKSTASGRAAVGLFLPVGPSSPANTRMSMPLPSSNDREQAEESPRTPGQVPQVDIELPPAAQAASQPPAVYESAEEFSTQGQEDSVSAYEPEAPQSLPDAQGLGQPQPPTTGSAGDQTSHV